MKDCLKTCLTLTLVLFLYGCDSNKNKTGEFSQYINEVASVREEKDFVFKTSPTSPLPADVKESFDTLSYYPVQPEYRIIADFLPLQGGVMEVALTNGKSERYYKTGYATFSIGQNHCSLLILRSVGSPNVLFLPFYDQTNGSETYGGGRYLNPQLISDNKIIIDFNHAYNPYCVYADEYICPLPPSENRLAFAVKAGEKLFMQSN